MIKPFAFSWLAAAVLLLPAVHAGSASAPELTDPADPALPGALDVTAAWFTPVKPGPRPTGIQNQFQWPLNRIENDFDCNFFHCDDGVTISVKLRDLTSAAPVADGAAYYHYEVSFTPSGWDKLVSVLCVVSAADIVAPAVGTGGQQTYVGTTCRVTTPEGNHEAFDVAAARVEYNRHQSDDFTLTQEGHVDRLGGTLRITLLEELANVGPGTQFKDLTVKTSLVNVRAGLPLFTSVAADEAGPGDLYVWG